MGYFTKAALSSLCLLKCLSLFSDPYTWNVDASGNWQDMTQWSPNTAYPSMSTDQALFGSLITSGVTVTILVPNVTVGSIQFDNVNGYTVAGSPLILTGASGPAIINITTLSGAHTISAPATLGSSLTITQASPGIFTISGAISGANSITVGGTTVTTFTSGTSSYSGGTLIDTGTLQISADSAGNTPLGAVAGAVSINTGTFQAGASFSTDPGRGFTLNGAANIDSQANALTIAGIIGGAGSLTKIGTGSLVLSNANTYSGGTIVSAGTLSISSDGNLGASSGTLALNGGTTLIATAPFNSSRTIILSGITTIDNANTNTLAGSITGSGSLTKTNAGLLILTGSNNYSGGTTISNGTLQGNTTSLPGNIVDNAALVFNQTFGGTYAGSLSGTGTLTIQGGGPLTMSNNSSGFSGTTLLTGNTQLIMTGNLSGSALTINAGSTLGGNGTVGTTSNSGTISPSSLSTITASGNLTFNGGSNLTLDIAPLANAKVLVTGTATLTGGDLVINPQSGFYGLSAVYTLLNANTLGGTTFNSLTITNSNFSGTLSYPNNNSAQLNVTILRPFLDFPFANHNEKAVGNNIDDLNVAGLISPDLEAVINSLVGQSFSAINNALDQMHPAAMSAMAELQFEIGGQVLSMFHRKPELLCSCSKSGRIWIEPYYNWFEEKQQGEEIGFRVVSNGIAFGIEKEFSDIWTIGVGGVWNTNNLNWALNRGHAYSESAYGALYSDLAFDNFYLGLSAYAGLDWYHTARGIHFSTIDRQADAHYKGVDTGAQLTAAYIFGAPVCLLYPYGTVDYLYLANESYTESGAQSLDLNVSKYTSSTLRSEAGIGFQFIDKNCNETVCLSPLVSLGWVMEWPLHRDHYSATFSGQTIPFTVIGWNETWQLLNARLGLAITYRCFTLDAQYILDTSIDGNTPFVNQRGNFRINYNF